MIKKKNIEHFCNQMLIEGKPENKQLKTHLFNTCKEFLAHQILDLKKNRKEDLIQWKIFRMELSSPTFHFVIQKRRKEKNFWNVIICTKLYFWFYVCFIFHNQNIFTCSTLGVEEKEQQRRTLPNLDELEIEEEEDDDDDMPALEWNKCWTIFCCLFWMLCHLSTAQISSCTTVFSFGMASHLTS